MITKHLVNLTGEWFTLLCIAYVLPVSCTVLWGIGWLSKRRNKPWSDEAYISLVLWTGFVLTLLFIAWYKSLPSGVPAQ